MGKFIDDIKIYEDFVKFGGVDDNRIYLAEEELGLRFNKEYREFIKKYGSACSNGHEFMGICDADRLNIVKRTLNAKNKNMTMPDDLYLIEDIGIDKILIWQNSSGTLFQTIGNSEPKLIKFDLCEYLRN